MPDIIRQKKVLAVEGKDEVNFFHALLEYVGITDYEIRDVGGKRQFKNNLAKAKAQAFLAAMLNIVNSVGVAAQKQYWDFDSEVLTEIKTFLENLK